MAATVARDIIPASVTGQTSTPLWVGPEAANFAGNVGTICISASGYVEEAAADPVTLILGLGRKAGSNTTAGAAEMEFVPALPGLVFEGTLEDETNNNHALVITNLWNDYALQLDATNDRWFVDENDTTASAVKIVRLQDPLGTVKARVLFVFMTATTIFG
jgi:hypothetical protein